jgi:hypothetical protein
VQAGSPGAASATLETLPEVPELAWSGLFSGFELAGAIGGMDKVIALDFVEWLGTSCFDVRVHDHLVRIEIHPDGRLAVFPDDRSSRHGC